MGVSSTPAFMDLAYRHPRHPSPGIAVVTTVGCPHCKRTKDTLHKLKLAYDEIELSRNLELLRSIKDHTQQSTVPQVGVSACVIQLRCVTDGVHEDGMPHIGRFSWAVR